MILLKLNVFVLFFQGGIASEIRAIPIIDEEDDDEIQMVDQEDDIIEEDGDDDDLQVC